MISRITKMEWTAAVLRYLREIGDQLDAMNGTLKRIDARLAQQARDIDHIARKP